MSQILALRSPHANAQVLQQQAFLPFRDLFAFLFENHPQLAEELVRAYSNTMRWYYSTTFARYKEVLEKVPLYTIDKQDALGNESLGSRGITNRPNYLLPT